MIEILKITALLFLALIYIAFQLIPDDIDNLLSRIDDPNIPKFKKIFTFFLFFVTFALLFLISNWGVQWFVNWIPDLPSFKSEVNGREFIGYFLSTFTGCLMLKGIYSTVYKLKIKLLEAKVNSLKNGVRQFRTYL